MDWQEEGISKILLAPGELNIEGVSGTRALKDNLSDLRAQVAANNQGIHLVQELVNFYGLNVVQVSAVAKIFPQYQSSLH